VIEKNSPPLYFFASRMKSLIPIVLGALVALSQAQETEPAIPNSAIKTALQWMQNADPSKRTAAYRTFQLYGDSGQDLYRKTLNAARDLHEDRVEQLIADERKNPFLELDQLAEKLESERERIYKLIKIDYQKDPTKIRMLLDEVEALEKMNTRARKLAAKDSQELDAAMLVIGTAMAEVERELKRAEGEEFEEGDLDPLKTLGDCYEGGVYLKTKSHVTMLRKEIAELEEARAANDAAAWANGSQKEFTHHLNNFRAIFALTPMRMEEKLSEAAVGHSQDMASLGFFSHTSPVEGKSSPGDRARMAAFKHAWSGENIFMGSGSPISAYNAWFGSDGHRFIMFSNGPNLIGIGPHGKHWTMMTGRK
jgi:uncharacterized protein YkwD